MPFSCAEYRGQGTSVAEKCEAICTVMDCNAVIIMLLEAAPPACERVMRFCGITSDVKLCGQKKKKISQVKRLHLLPQIAPAQRQMSDFRCHIGGF